jgi:FtsH-binding integral membrane protein
MIYLAADSNKNDYRRRVPVFWAFCGLKGISLGGLFEVVLMVDPAILVIAGVATCVIFGCFSLSAMLARRRSYLYLGGLLSSALSALMIVNLLGLVFGRNSTLDYASLIMGLCVFSGYVIFDTQAIIEKASNYDRDFVGHALELFTDFVAILVRIIILLLRNQERRERKRRRE